MTAQLKVTTTSESLLLTGELSTHRFTNPFGVNVEHEVFQQCGRVFPQYDSRLMCQRERHTDGSSTWTIDIPDDYPLVIYLKPGYFEQFRGVTPQVVWRPQPELRRQLEQSYAIA